MTLYLAIKDINWDIFHPRLWFPFAFNFLWTPWILNTFPVALLRVYLAFKCFGAILCPSLEYQRIYKLVCVVLIADLCTREEHLFLRYKVMPGDGCRSFCQCAPLTHNTYSWVRKGCPENTLWDERINICNHAYNVECSKYFKDKGVYSRIIVVYVNIVYIWYPIWNVSQFLLTIK